MTTAFDPRAEPPPAAPGSAEGADERLHDERRRAVRLLLARPLLADTAADPELFVLVRRHERWLKRWFSDHMGYRLVVDTDLARLHKRPAPGARVRPAASRSGTPFDPRRYALACLVLAALDKVEMQTTLSDLAAQVRVLAGSEAALADFDLERYAERLAFVDAVRWLVDLDVMSLTDGDETAFVESRGDALYDVHPRRSTQLLATALPPSVAAGPEELLEQVEEVYPATDDGANRRIRHRLMRRLVEEPVVYLEDLEPAERAYLASQRPHLVRQVGEATGMEVEVRREGLAALDPEDRLSDLAFPSSGTVSHAALLLGELLAERGRRAEAAGEPAPAVPWSELAGHLYECFERYGRRWSKRYRESTDGAERLLADAIERLEGMGLARRLPAGVVPLPAVARLRPEEPETGTGESDG